MINTGILFLKRKWMMENNMNWKKLFATHILERGYDYYCDGAVENMEVGHDDIQADVVGTEDYEVEISLNDGEVTDMYCSCPYAAGGNNCKHMAAVLYEWTADIMDEDEPEDMDNDAEYSDLFKPTVTVCDYKKKSAAVEKLVSSAESDLVQAFLVSVLAEDKKLLLRFRNMVNKCATKEDVEDYFEQIDEIADRYLGRDHFINYYQASDFMSELEEIIDKDVRRMIDNGSHISAFHVMNHMFVLLGNVDMDDSGGETSMLAEQIYQLWLELLTKVNAQDKRKMFTWFTTHMDEVNKMASYTGNRKHYASLVALLRRMKRIKGGTEIVKIIVGDWKIKYRNRPAMMDELSKL